MPFDKRHGVTSIARKVECFSNMRFFTDMGYRRPFLFRF